MVNKAALDTQHFVVMFVCIHSVSKYCRLLFSANINKYFLNPLNSQNLRAIRRAGSSHDRLVTRNFCQMMPGGAKSIDWINHEIKTFAYIFCVPLNWSTRIRRYIFAQNTKHSNSFSYARSAFRSDRPLNFYLFLCCGYSICIVPIHTDSRMSVRDTTRHTKP